jgi:hypothetical protein
MSAERFVRLNVYALFILVLASFAGIAVLPFVSFSLIAWIAIEILFRTRMLSVRASTDILIGWGFGILFSGIAFFWLKEVWVAPSQDDTMNHLGFLDAILRSHLALLGEINRPGSDWFGTSPYHFYPTGSHAIAALWIYPFSLLGFDWPKVFKVFQIITFGFLPAFSWWSSLRVFPMISRELRIFILISAMTALVFPLAAMGEGGFSRVFALTFFVPFWFRYFEKDASFLTGVLSAAVFAPILLFVHPVLLPLIVLGTLLSKKRVILGSLIGAPLGALFFYFILHSARQEVTQPGFLEALVSPLRHDAFGWFDRLKGPFHYWFSDPLGYGKFLSPKNYFVYLAVILSILGRIPRRTFLIFLLPFAMAALALTNNPLALQFGLIFYHSVKRISELTPLLGFTLACFSANWISTKFTVRKSARILALGLSTVFLTLYCIRGTVEMNAVLDLFHTPRNSVTASWGDKIKTLGLDDRILIDQHPYDGLRYVTKSEAYTLLPECGEVGEPSDYCKTRRAFGADLLEKQDFQFSGKIWWLPSQAEYAHALEIAQIKKLPELPIDEHVSLIQIYPKP